jgi:hypothetical protein
LKKWRGKHFFAATTGELLEVVLSLWSALRPCGEDKREKLVSRRPELAISPELQMSSSKFVVDHEKFPLLAAAT